MDKKRPYQWKKIGEYLKSARESSGYSQEDIAELFGVSPTTVSYWETGRSLPRADRLSALAKRYEVSLDSILEQEEVLYQAENRQYTGLSIKAFREKLGLTQEELANRYGCSAAHLARIEDGRIGLELEQLDRFATILDEPVESLIPDWFETEQTAPHDTLSLNSGITKIKEIIGQIKEGPSGSQLIHVFDEKVLVAPNGSLNLAIEPIGKLYIPFNTWTFKTWAIQVHSDSVSPVIQKGDIVLVNPEISPTNNKYVVSSHNDSVGVKLFRQTDTDAWLEDNLLKLDFDDCLIHGVIFRIIRDI